MLEAPFRSCIPVFSNVIAFATVRSITAIRYDFYIYTKVIFFN